MADGLGVVAGWLPYKIESTRGSDGYVNRWFLDPLSGRGYPDDMLARYEEIVGTLEFVRDGDLTTNAARADFLGVNDYARRVIQAVVEARLRAAVRARPCRLRDAEADAEGQCAYYGEVVRANGVPR